MSMTMRLSNNMAGSGVQALTGLTDEQIGALQDDYQIVTLQDLAVLDKNDIDVILGSEKLTFLARRKSCSVATFIKKGGNLNSCTTMSGVILIDMRHGVVPSLPPPPPSTKSTAPIWLSPADFLSFSGEIEDQENYRTKAEAQIGQTAFKFLLFRDANSFHGDKAYNVITKSLKDEHNNTVDPSGRRVWLNFLEWCNSGGRKNTLLKNDRKEMNDLKLDGDGTDGFDCVNQHILRYNKLDNLSAKMTETDWMTIFVNNIVDPDFETVKQFLENHLLEIDCGDRVLKVKELTNMVESRQRKLDNEWEDNMELKSRQLQF
eukprot:15364664-Ditylum_brightwellii.AAC.1